MEDIFPLIVARVKNQPTLHALTFVNKAFNTPATTSLYTTVRFSTIESMVLFFTNAPSWAPEKVQHLELEIQYMRMIKSDPNKLTTSIANSNRKLSPITIDLRIGALEIFKGIDTWETQVTMRMFYGIFGTIFNLDYQGPKHFRARYIINGKSVECPFDIHGQIMTTIKNSKICQTIELPILGPHYCPARLDRPLWPISNYNIKSISLTGSTFGNWRKDRMGDWLAQTSKFYTKGNRMDKRKNKCTRKIRLDIRKPLVEVDRKEFSEEKDPEGIFDIVLVDEERENESAEQWRNRVMNEVIILE